MNILTINNPADSVTLHYGSDLIHSKEELTQYLPYFKEMKQILKPKNQNDPHNGLGLALPQVGVNKAGFIMRKGEQYQIAINPKILSYNDKKGKKDYVEGCLSIPDQLWMVSRYREIKVVYRDENYNVKIEVLKGIDAEVFQHEYDHLQGVLISDIGVKFEEIGA